MNRFLANSLAFLNAVIAVTNIAVCAAAGMVLGRYGGEYYHAVDPNSYMMLGMILGGLLGLLWSVVFNGFLALVIDIRNELRSIRQASQPQPTFSRSAPVAPRILPPLTSA